MFLDDERAWLLLALQSGGRARHLALVYSRAGSLQASAEAELGDGSWLGTLQGKCATRGMLLAPTGGGIVRVEVQRGSLQTTREFPDTAPFVDAASRLLAGNKGLYVVGRREITLLEIH